MLCEFRCWRGVWYLNFSEMGDYIVPKTSLKYIYILALQFYIILFHIHSFIHSIGMCRMRQFLAFLRSFLHFSLLCTFLATLLHQLFFHPLSLHLASHFLVNLSIFLFPNSYIILFWEFIFFHSLCTPKPT